MSTKENDIYLENLRENIDEYVSNNNLVESIRFILNQGTFVNKSKGSKRILEVYESADENTQIDIDLIFYNLCGFSLMYLTELMDKKNEK